MGITLFVDNLPDRLDAVGNSIISWRRFIRSARYLRRTAVVVVSDSDFSCLRRNKRRTQRLDR